MSNEFALFGRDLFGDVVKPSSRGVVADRFTWPPFSVLDARTGEWQARKRAWSGIGIKSEIGRPEGLQAPPGFGDYIDGDPRRFDDLATSIFDPVICELAVRWFCPPAGQVVDPFAGGSVRGIVSGALGRRYWGCDLRPEQIDANERQADAIETPIRPTWFVGDALDAVPTAPDSDFVFSCPPYGDLERYSDDARDISTMEWPTFVAAYSRIILRCVAKMKPDTFAAFVVGDFRCPRGFYRNFTGKTVEAFEAAGARYYNEIVIATPLGSAAMRAPRQFTASRKLVKTHQNLLVFCKGNPMEAARKCAAGDGES